MNNLERMTAGRAARDAIDANLWRVMQAQAYINAGLILANPDGTIREADGVTEAQWESIGANPRPWLTEADLLRIHAPGVRAVRR